MSIFLQIPLFLMGTTCLPKIRTHISFLLRHMLSNLLDGPISLYFLNLLWLFGFLLRLQIWITFGSSWKWVPRENWNSIVLICWGGGRGPPDQCLPLLSLASLWDWEWGNLQKCQPLGNEPENRPIFISLQLPHPPALLFTLYLVKFSKIGAQTIQSPFFTACEKAL